MLFVYDNFANIGVWDLTHNRFAGQFDGHAAGVFALAFSPQADLLASAGEDETILLWDTARLSPRPAPTATPQPQPTPSSEFTFGQGQPVAMAYRPDGELLLAASNGLYVVQAKAASQILAWDGPKTAGEVALSANGEFAANAVFTSTTNQWQIQVYGTADGELLRAWPVRHGEPVDGVDRLTFSPDGQYLAASLGTDLVIWKTADGQETLLPINTFISCALAFSPDNQSLASQCGSQLTVYSLPQGEAHIIPTGCRGDYGYALAYAPDRRLLVSACGPGQHPIGFLTFADPQRYNQVFYWDECGGIRSLAYSPNGQTLAIGFFDGSFYLLDHNGQFKQSFTGRDSGENPFPVEGATYSEPRAIIGLAFAPDGQSLALAFSDGVIWVWSLGE